MVRAGPGVHTRRPGLWWAMVTAKTANCVIEKYVGFRIGSLSLQSTHSCDSSFYTIKLCISIFSDMLSHALVLDEV